MTKTTSEPSEIEPLAGSVENVRFRNEETGYVVCDVKPAESMMSMVTVVVKVEARGRHLRRVAPRKVDSVLLEQQRLRIA